MGSILAGASGNLLKEIRSAEIIDAIRQVACGRPLLDPAVTAGVIERLRQGKDEYVLAQLTKLEQKVLDLITDGQTNREIAVQINLSDRTVKDCVSKILGKLEVSRRSQTPAGLAKRRGRRGRRPDGP